AGGLHAISGPDHLAALLPRVMGMRFRASLRIGAVWGLGHGLSATMIGLAAFFCKEALGGGDSMLVARLGGWTDGLVGASLICIGLLGLKESLLDHAGEDGEEEGGESGGGRSRVKGAKRAIFFNGLLHGFCWDGAPSLMPALSCSTWNQALMFLMAYCSGTVLAMSAATTVIGEGSVRVGEAMDQPDIPRKLSIVSSGIAIAVGVLWLLKALLF
ncbi:unnamed protein product, partial [Chrysoparadoxa australica]